MLGCANHLQACKCFALPIWQREHQFGARFRKIAGCGKFRGWVPEEGELVMDSCG